ncbi:MAG TPA: hypothetical protein VK763_06160 [Terriglobales bacterium]|jgi:hypothetical protein|nr:hypothetical protein [Terriglobales bacterium]
MKHHSPSDRALLIIVTVGLLLPVARGEATRRIRLPTPGKSMSIEGKLHSMEDHAEFDFQAMNGTKVKIELSGSGPLRGQITFPSGKLEGSPGGTVLDQVLVESGRYRLRVSESSMGESWEGAFNLKISVTQ